jgi:hypothetical protein
MACESASNTTLCTSSATRYEPTPSSALLRAPCRGSSLSVVAGSFFFSPQTAQPVRGGRKGSPRQTELEASKQNPWQS